MIKYSERRKGNHNTISEAGELPLEEIKGFVIVVYNDQWWIGCVLHIMRIPESFNISASKEIIIVLTTD